MNIATSMPNHIPPTRENAWIRQAGHKLMPFRPRTFHSHLCAREFLHPQFLGSDLPKHSLVLIVLGGRIFRCPRHHLSHPLHLPRLVPQRRALAGS